MKSTQNKELALRTAFQPFPRLHEWREEGPVIERNLRVGLGLPVERHYAEVREFVVLSFEDCRHVLASPDLYSSRAYAAQHDLKMGDSTMLSTDADLHASRRAMFSDWFRPRDVSRRAGAIVRYAVEGLLNEWDCGQPLDFMDAFARPLPARVIAELMGVPTTDWRLFLGWTTDMVHIGDDPARGLEAGAAMQDYMRTQLERKRRDPADDIISQVAHEGSVQGLPDSAVIAQLNLLLAAGGETTARALGSLIGGLLRDESQLECVKHGAASPSQASEEALRWEPPLPTVRRVATRDVALASVNIPRGAHVVAHIGAANRDPARWPKPDVFDVLRAPETNLAFGFGPHYCLGAPLARLEMATALEVILQRVGGFKLADGADVSIEGTTLRGPNTLLVDFDEVHTSG